MATPRTEFVGAAGARGPADRYLIDTSVWLDVLPRQPRHAALRMRVDALVATGTAVTVGVVRTELLRGARDDAQYHRLERLLSALPELPTADDTWTRAGRLGFQLRRQALTVAIPDLLIAVLAMSADAVVVHRDHDFDLLARHVPLRVESHL